MEKNSSLFKIPEEVVDEIYEWAEYEYLSRLLPKLETYLGRYERLHQLRKDIKNALDAPRKSWPVEVFSLDNNLQKSYSFVRGVMGLYKHYAKISEFINEHIVKYSESEFMIKEVNDKLLANFSQLKTIKSTKYTASTTFTYKNNTFNISLEFGRDDKQTSRIYHDNYFIIIYLNQDRYFKEIDHELRLEFHLSELKEHIAHEVTHLEQFVTGKGYPPRKLREKGVDFDGYPLHKKPSGKVVKRHKREILHGLIDAEFWANLRSLKLTWTAYLQVTPKKERLEMLKELIEEDVTIEEMKSNPEKRRLFIKHLVSNLQDLL